MNPFRQGVKTLLPLIVFFFGVLFASAQYRVTATVIDEEGNPEEFATYRIFELPDTTRQIMGNVTKSDGVIDASLSKAGEYRIMISSMMKLPVSVDFIVNDSQPVTDLGIISTEFSGETLDELTVVAQRPLVTKEIDRIGYDVQADGEASTSSLREILKKVPLVSVDEEGNIKVNGSDNFKIYRNGRPNNAYTKNAKDIFAAIPASSIKKIEVITDPGAGEDAESSGIILNIVTTSTVSMSGVSGNIGFNYNTNFGPQANAFIMTQLKKLTLSVSGGYYDYLWRNNYSEEWSRMKYEETDDELEAYSRYALSNRGGWFNVEGSLELDTLNLITTSINGFMNNNAASIYSEYTLFNPNGFKEYSYQENARYGKYGYTDIDFNFDYQRSTRLKGETITLSYRLSHTRQDQDLNTEYNVTEGNPFNYTAIISDFDLKFFEHTFQLDWSRPLGSHYKLDTGAKYILRTSHSINHQNLVDEGRTFDDFKHSYNIFGIYVDARAMYGNFSARVGARYEYSKLEAEFLTGDRENFHANLNDVVPNASVAWNASESSMWKLSYSRRIQRPGISYLNPAVSISPNYVSFGNPDLKSSNIDNLVLNYSFSRPKFYLDLSLSYNMTNNGTGTLQWTDLDNVTYSTYSNLMHARNITLSAFYQWQITDKTSWMLNGNIGWVKYSNFYVENAVRLARWKGYFYTRIQQKIPWDLTLSLSADYYSGNVSSVYSYSVSRASSISYSIGLNRSFLKDKTLYVNISVNNLGIKNWTRDIYYVNSGRTGSKIDVTHHNQKLSIGISWRFGNLKTEMKKTDKSISNDDLEGRKNN